MLCGQALLPVHAMVHYDRRPDGECFAGAATSLPVPSREARGSTHGSTPPRKKGGQRRRQSGGAYNTVTGRKPRGRRPLQHSRRPLARAGPSTLEELSGWAGQVSEVEQQWAAVATEGVTEDDEFRRPNRRHAAALLTRSMANAAPLSPEEALASRRYPWRMPFLIKPPQPVRTATAPPPPTPPPPPLCAVAQWS